MFTAFLSACGPSVRVRSPPEGKINHYLQILTVAKSDVTQRKISTEATSYQEKNRGGGDLNAFWPVTPRKRIKKQNFLNGTQ